MSVSNIYSGLTSLKQLDFNMFNQTSIIEIKTGAIKTEYVVDVYLLVLFYYYYIRQMYNKFSFSHC